ncbi:MAG: metal-dependent hydrolase [Pseudomonadota bacterium]
MSSFIGHALTASFIFVSHRNVQNNINWPGACWLGWLVLVALAPDLDYIVTFLNKTHFAGLRVTHSILFTALPPLLTIIVLAKFNIRKPLKLSAIQVIAASQSHLILDFLVGVHPLPLFWPLSDAAFRTPVGVLPSAGALNLTNFYFYRNLAIELGVLIPLYLCIQLWIHQQTKHHIFYASLLLMSIFSMYLAYNLVR